MIEVVMEAAGMERMSVFASQSQLNAIAHTDHIPVPPYIFQYVQKYQLIKILFTKNSRYAIKMPKMLQKKI